MQNSFFVQNNICSDCSIHGRTLEGSSAVIFVLDDLSLNNMKCKTNLLQTLLNLIIFLLLSNIILDSKSSEVSYLLDSKRFQKMTFIQL